MKTTSPLAKRIALPRNFGIIDTLVFMLAAALFGAWVLGTLFLTFFSGGASAGSQTAALADGEDGSGDVPAATDTQGADDGTPAVNDSGDPNSSNATGGNFNPNGFKAGGDLASGEKTALEQKISKLQELLESKSEELTRLRKTSMKAEKPDPKEAANTSKYKNQISQLTKQKDRLDRDIKKLNALSKVQTTKIQTLQDQLVAVETANPIAAEASAGDNVPAVGGANQPLEFRDWISSKGNPARLAFVRWEDDEIVLVNEANKEFRLTLERLSPADQDYVNSKR